VSIAPAPSVVNRAPGMNVRLLQKAQDIICEFDDIDIFSKNNDIIGKEEELRKALMAPSGVSDLQNTPGGVITKQSIEGAPSSLTLSEKEGLDFIDAIIGIKQKKIPLKKAEYLKYFKSQNKQDFGDKSYKLISKYFKNK
jgi:hypothetical protein